MADYFISDLHLSDKTPYLLQALSRFVDDKRHDISRLFILGDLFEFWVGDDYQTDCSRRCADILSKLPDVRFIAGNRDFLLGQDYARQAGGMMLLPETIVMNVCGHKTVVTHGDHLCIDDVEYQKIRSMLRNRQWQQNFLGQSIEERCTQAYQARMTSKQNSKNAVEEIMDVNTGAVMDCIRQNNAEILLHGHTHKPALHDLESGLKRIVLGDWGSRGWFIRADENVASLVSFTIDDDRAEERILATIDKP